MSAIPLMSFTTMIKQKLLSQTNPNTPYQANKLNGNQSEK
jgi:hypothetical protein